MADRSILLAAFEERTDTFALSRGRSPKRGSKCFGRLDFNSVFGFVVPSKARAKARKCGGRIGAHEISRSLKNSLVPRLKFSADSFPHPSILPFFFLSVLLLRCIRAFHVYSMKRKRGRIVEEYDSRYDIFQPRTKNRRRNTFEF